MMKKIILLLLVVGLMATPAFGGNIPEFDAVGCDSQNVFNDFIKDAVVENNRDGFDRQINYFSDFGSEWFTNTAGQDFPDPCFNDIVEGGYNSALTDAYNEATYSWSITLQMKPESDIDLNIVDCVMKHNEFDVWTGAEQTGRYRAPWGQLFFVPMGNPTVTVQAFPGQYATPGFNYPGFYMDARTLPGLYPVPMIDALYTSKALWEEGIVMVLPETGTTNSEGQAVYNLKQGDRINVIVTIPGNNTCDIRYGRDNVVLKYIGIVGTEYVNTYGYCDYPS